MQQLTEGYTRHILDSISTAVVTTDLEGLITSFNKAACKMFELTLEEAFGVHYKVIMADEENERLIRTVNWVIDKGKTWQGEDIEFVIQNGKKIIINPSISPLVDFDGKIIGVAMVTENVTEKRQLERYLQQSEKLAALGEMSIGIAHEIRNPLGAIHGFTSLLGMDFGKDDPRQQFVDVITKETERLSRITEELLDFAKPSTTSFQQVSLAQILERVLILFQMELAVHHEVDFHYHISGRFPEICADPKALQQVFLNILTNALQAVKEPGGKIILAADYQAESDWLQVKVEDNGSGISQQNLEKIFDPFFTTKERGTGLGLAIAHRLVSQHKGIISVESELGRGSSFIVKLPSKERMMLR